MAFFVPLKDIVQPRHFAAYCFRNRTSDERVRMDVYSGWLSFTFAPGDDAPVKAETVVSFLPINSFTVLQFQSESDLLDVTVSAAVSSVADYDDEANVEAVNFASVRLEPQVIGGVAGTPFCLVLRARVAALASKIHGITYQVTTLTGSREEGVPLDLNKEAAPDK